MFKVILVHYSRHTMRARHTIDILDKVNVLDRLDKTLTISNL